MSKRVMLLSLCILVIATITAGANDSLIVVRAAQLIDGKDGSPLRPGIVVIRGDKIRLSAAICQFPKAQKSSI